MIRATAIVAASLLAGCAWFSTPEAKRVERGILRVADVLCVLSHSTNTAPAIIDACGIERSLEPAVLELLAAHKAASKRELVSACSERDAGKGDAP